MPLRRVTVWLLLTVAANIYQPSTGCQCGQTQGMRIVKGNTIIKGTYPWMAVMRTKKADHHEQLCGATLISSNYALTAFHCTNVPAEDTFLLAGTDMISDTTSSSSQILQVDSFIQYEPEINHHETGDIALVKLKSPAVFDEFVQPICLPLNGSDFRGKNASFCGYGSTGDEPNSKQLLGSSGIVATEDECQAAVHHFKKHRQIDRQICAGTYGGTPGTCLGDSGGPLMCYDPIKGVWELIGVTSETYGCVNPEGYGMFTEVARYIDWIQNNTGNAGCVK